MAIRRWTWTFSSTCAVYLIICSVYINEVQCTSSCSDKFSDWTTGTEYTCPKGECSTNDRDVWGTYNYTDDSSICLSAWNDGRIIPWSNNDTDRKVTWRDDAISQDFFASSRYGSVFTKWYVNTGSFASRSFTSPRKREHLYYVSTLSSPGSRVVQVHGGRNVDFDIDVIAGGVYDSRTSAAALSGPTDVESGLNKHKQFTTNGSSGVYTFTVTGTKTNLYSRVVTPTYVVVPQGNVARGKPTDQSSTLITTHFNGSSSKAVDGNKDTNFINGRSCTHTLKRGNLQNPWWRVDLQEVHVISEVTITSRNGSYDCKNDTMGLDYQGTVNTAKGYPSECLNWASSKHPTVPSNYCRNPDNTGSGPWCYVTPEGWVTCGDRISTCGDLNESLKEFDIRVSNDTTPTPTPLPSSTDSLCKYHQEVIPASTTVDISCDSPVYGRYLYILKKGAGSSETLSLCEVAVRGYTISDYAPANMTTRASIGDTVTLSFTGVQSPGIKWKKDGNAFFGTGAITSWNGRLSNTITNVKIGHGGVYTLSVGGMLRLIVRVCPAGKYGGLCEHNCPTCHNGGICHDVMGECICPPGFMGDDCSTACDGNRFGYNCTSRCSTDANDPVDGCKYKHVCTIDPYGCSCATGFKGLACDRECDEGYYGADCSQTCGECVDHCDIFTGHCKGGCNLGGYKLPYCKEACDNGTHGVNCSKTCGHCVDGEICDKVTGECTCIIGFNPPTCKEECSAGTYGESCASACGNCKDGSGCNKTNGQCECIPGYKSPTCHTEIAKLSEAPSITRRTIQSFTVMWRAWTSASDTGEGPVNTYIVEYRTLPDGVWQQSEDIAAADMTHSITPDEPLKEFSVRIKIRIANGDIGNASFETSACGVPDTPTLNASASGRNKVSASWTMTNWRCSTNLSFTLEYKNETAWIPITGVASTTLEKTFDSKPCVDWSFRIQAYNTHLNSSVSALANTTSMNDAPGKVQRINVTSVTNQSMTLSWDAPVSNGCDVLRYVVTYKLMKVLACDGEAVEDEVRNSTNSTTFTITRLVSNARYEISVAAETNFLGPKATKTAETLEDVPSASPLHILTSPYSRSAFVSWQQPSCVQRNGAITGYELELTIKENHCMSAFENSSVIALNGSLNHTFKDLSPSTAYSFRIRAYTRKGTGPWSEIKQFSTTEEPLDGVSMFNVTEVIGSLTLSWSQPEHDDGCLLRRYEWNFQLISRSQCDNSGERASNWTSSVNTTAIVYGIYPHSTYQVSVRPIGISIPGKIRTRTITTRQTVPSAPPYVVISNTTSRSTYMSWSAPACIDINGVIKNYIYNVTSQSSDCQSASTTSSTETGGNDTLSATIGLKPWTKYTVYVAACTVLGCSPWANATVETLEEELGVVGSLNVWQVDRMILVNWTTPTDDGCQLQGYEWKYQVISRGSCQNWSTAASDWMFVNSSTLAATIEDVYSYSSYEVKVRPNGPHIKGLEKSFVLTTHETVPSEPPSVLVSNITSRSAYISWTPPDCTNVNGVITHYKYNTTTQRSNCQSALVNTNNVTDDNKTLSATVVLAPWTKYLVYLSACTQIGCSRWTNCSFESHEEALASVPSIKVEQINKTLDIQWTTPVDDGCQLQGYEWSYQVMSQGKCPNSSLDASSWKRVDETILKASVPNVLDYSQYVIYVRPMGPTMEGAEKSENVTTFETAPSAPPHLTISNTTSISSNISWSPPECTKTNGELTGYRYNITTPKNDCPSAMREETRVINNTDTTSLSFHLAPWTNYTVLITACTRAGCGPWAKSNVETPEEQLGAVTNIHVHQFEKSLSMNWTAPVDDGCQLQGYQWNYKVISQGNCSNSSTDTSSWHDVDRLTTNARIENVYNYSQYLVSIRAKGPSRRGVEVSTTKNTLQAAPSSPPIISVDVDTFSPRSVDISWFPPECTERNGIVTSYNYRIVSNKPDCPSALFDIQTAVNTTVTSAKLVLVPWTNYTLSMNVCTAAGCSRLKSVDFKTKEETLGNVSSMTVSQTGQTLNATWAPPADEGCQLQGYEWRYQVVSRGQCMTSGIEPTKYTQITETTVALPDVFNNSVYNITVRPVGPTTTGEALSVNKTTEERAPSGPPLDVISTSKSSTSIRFNWTKPECSRRNGHISSYNFALKREAVGNCLDEEVVNNSKQLEQHLFNKLTSFVKYSFRVQAVVGVCKGPWSEWINETTKQGAPTKVIRINVTAKNSSSASLSWNLPCPPNGVITEIILNYSSRNRTDTGNETCVNCTTLSAYNLSASDVYMFKVIAKTVAWGEWSDEKDVRIEEAPPERPSFLTCTNEDLKKDSIHIEWSAPSVTNGVIQKYKVATEGKNPIEVDASHGLGKTITDLVAGTCYQVKVSARTSAGYGPPHMTSCWTALPDVPALDIPEIDKDKMTDTTVTITLSPATEYPKKEFIKYYLVVVERMKKRKRREIEINETSLKDFEDSGDDPRYIAANLTVKEVEETITVFTVGDGNEYGDYMNEKLVKGSSYKFIFGFRIENEVDHDTYFQAIGVEGAEEVSVEVRNYKQERLDAAAATNATIGGVVGAIVAILVVLAVVGFLFYRRRQRGKQPDGGIQMDDISKIEVELPANNDNDGASGVSVRPKEKPIAPPKPKPKAKPVQTGPEYANFSKPIDIDDLSEYTSKGLHDDTLSIEYQSLPSGHIFPRGVALTEENKKKNRFLNILAYDKNRLLLEKIGNDPSTDYINASYIDAYKKPKAYIAAQGPNKYTVNDFWRMIWQEKITRIVMLTNPVENGKRKCEQYWPDSHDVETYGEINVSLTDKDRKKDYTVCTFEILKRDSNDARDLTHFHFTSWPDHGVPDNSSALWKFYRVVKENMTEDESTVPTVVHCSAGVGRTGTFILLDILTEQAGAENQVDVLGQLYNLRQQRVNMVQTADQYDFIYTAMVESLQSGDTFIPSGEFNTKFVTLCMVDPASNTSEILKEYRTLRRICPAVDPDDCAAGKLAENAKKNRFPNILPIGRARPYLMTPGEAGSTDYINAVFVNGYKHRDAFIVTQMPLPNTVVDFWRMVSDHDSHTIVMLNDGADTEPTCAQYWPEEGSAQYGRFQVDLVGQRFEHGETIIQRTFMLQDTKKRNGTSRQIKQFEIKSWPKNQKIPPPEVRTAFIELADDLERRQQKTGNKSITVHCLDGTTRSGFFCAMNCLFERIKVEQGVDVFQTVKTIRTNRPQFITGMDQYKSLYQMAQRFILSFETYANFR